MARVAVAFVLLASALLFWLLPVDDGHQFEGFGLVYWEANACGRPVIGALRSGAEKLEVNPTWCSRPCAS